MANLKLLKEKISESGMTMVYISEKTGILRETLYNKLNGKSEFLASEILSLTKVLHLSRQDRDDIFFDEKLN